MMNNKTMTLSRDDLGFRFFAKDDKLFQTVATGVLDENGKMTYRDELVSESQMDARAALTVEQYKLVDRVVLNERNRPNRFSTWLRGLTGNVETFDGMSFKTYWYDVITGRTASRSTMDLEDDAPGTTVQSTRDGVPLPLEFADWLSNIRRDPSTNIASGYDVTAEKAKAAAESVATGLDLRLVNGWGELKYDGVTAYGWRDLPTDLTVAQAGTGGPSGWLSPDVTSSQIYANITAMVRLLNTAKIPGPYVLTLPESFRFRLAETFSTAVNGDEKSLWMKILEKPDANIPNVLDIAEIKLVPEMDETKDGNTPSVGEAYLSSLDTRYFRVLNYLAMQSFTIALKGTISTKHRVVEGLCPLFKKNPEGLYGMVKLAAPDA